MSKHKDQYDASEEFSLDELMADNEWEPEENDAEKDYFEETPAADAPEEDFVPDFGDAFSDYGEYEDEYAPEEDDADEGDADEEQTTSKPKRRKRIVPLYLKVLIYIVAVTLVSIGLGYAAWECAQDVLAFGRSSDMAQVVVKETDSLDDVAQMLKEKGMIKYPRLFKLYCNFTGSADRIEAGTYELCYNYDYHALASGMRSSSPNRSTVRVMIPEGKTCAQIFALMEENGVCEVTELQKCAAETEFDYWFLEGIPYGADNRLEGFLFPDTYDFYVGDNPERVLDKLLSNFNRKFSEEAVTRLEELNAELAERLSKRGYDEEYIQAHRMGVFELITVASMIEKETAGVSESGEIASVIYNRLCRPADYPYLNVDATIVYALGGINRPLTYEDTQLDSPYNTYNHAGLPAGPIANPGLNSIAAALNPSETDYYFYALDKGTGMHHFSSTYEAHQRFLEEQNNEE